MQGILFAYHIKPHISTKYSPFYVLYQNEAILPVNIKHNLQDGHFYEENIFTENFDKNKFEETLKSMLHLVRGNLNNSMTIIIVTALLN